jgi:two-component system response regulator FixJ
MVEADNVYIVDDDYDVRTSIVFMLDIEGIAARAFASGREFLGALDELEPGCILLDIRMPDIDGVEVLRELKRRDCDWPVIVMTGHGEPGLAEEIRLLGASEYLAKPFVAEALIERLSKERNRPQH